jgi:PAS domain S-box-containing protein
MMATLTNFRRMSVLAALFACGLVGADVAGAAPRWHGVIMIAATTLGVAWLCAGVRRHRPTGAAWPVLVGAGGLVLACTLAWWTPVALGGGPPAQPSLTDIGYIVDDQLIALGLLLALARRETPLFVVLDVLTVFVGVGLVVGVAVVGPDFASSIVPMEVRATQAAYVVSDVVLIAVALRLLLAPRPRPLAAWLVACALVATVFSDVAWNWLTISGAYLPGWWGGIGWDLQPLLLGLAALHPSMRRFGVRETRADITMHPAGALLLGAAACMAPLLLGLHWFTPSVIDIDNSLPATLAVTLGGASLAALIVTRFSILLSRGRALAGALESALDERSRSLEFSEARYRRLVEQLPGIVYVFAVADMDVDEARPVYVSPQVESIAGISADTWLGGLHEILDRVHEDDRLGFLTLLERARAGASPGAVEMRFRRPDGTDVWLRDETAVVTGSGADRQVQGLLFDITDAKDAEAERARMDLELRLAQKLEAVGQLAAGIAHEINTPTQFVGDTVRFLADAFDDLLQLTAAYGRLRDAAQDGAVGDAPLAAVREAEELADLEYLTERVPAALQRAEEGIGRVTSIVRAMGEFAHPPTTEPVPVDINQALRSTLVVATNKYKYVADVEMEFGELPLVMAEAGDLNQVFLNLIINAAHAIEDVVAETMGRGTIEIRTALEGDHVHISVADTGCGIPPEVAARMYDPFFTTKAVGRGTGQGLSIARTIVERHDGELTFETEPGRGSTFDVRLPVAGRASQARKEVLAA